MIDNSKHVPPWNIDKNIPISIINHRAIFKISITIPDSVILIPRIKFDVKTIYDNIKIFDGR